MYRTISAFFFALLVASVVWGQASSPSTNQPSTGHQAMPGMDMPASEATKSTPGGPEAEKDDKETNAAAMHSMEGHIDMGPHMKMTTLRATKPDDTDRAQKVADAAKKVAEKYADYHTALADGFQIFLPNIPQKMYHFTNYGYAMEASFRFNPEHPTSLLYEKHGDDYKLIGVMYTAPKRYTEEQLDERIPLSIAQWHEHVNYCSPPAGRKKEVLDPHPQFGLHGSITTQAACDAAGGTFHPVIFNWMVHLYPFEKKAADIWSVSRQHND